jgi:hypothetical protein
MTGLQITLLLAMVGVLVVVTAAEMLHWLPSGRGKAVILTVAGFSMIGLLYAAGLPPQWFSGSWRAFGLGLFLTASAFAGRTPEEASFRRPLLGSMGVGLLVANVMAHV